MKSQSHCPIPGRKGGGEGPLSPALPALSVSPVPEILGNATSLRVWEGQSLHLVCVIDSNPPANVSWARGSLTLSHSQPLDPAVLELPQVVLGDGGEVTCSAQHPSGSDRMSLNLVVLGEYKQRSPSSLLSGCAGFSLLRKIFLWLLCSGFLLRWAV